jgi:hypothetical protein
MINAKKMNCNLKGGRGLSQLEGRVIIRTQNCNFNIDHLLLFPQIPTKACRHWAARCGLHKNPMLHLSYWELKPFHGFFPIRKLQFWVLTPPAWARLSFDDQMIKKACYVLSSIRWFFLLLLWGDTTNEFSRKSIKCGGSTPLPPLYIYDIIFKSKK